MKQYHTQSVVSKSCSGGICVSDKATSISHIVKRLLHALAALFIFAGLSAVTHAEEIKETPATQADLTAVKEWRLSQVGDQAIVEGSSVTLIFDDKNGVSGSGGVNRYGGKYESKADGEITFKNIFSTERAALDENLMNQESQFLRLLQNAKRALLSEGNLVLECDDKDDKKIRLVFVAVKNP